MSRRRLSLPRLLGLGHDEPPAHADEPVEEFLFLDPYQSDAVAGDWGHSREAGEAWRDTWSTEPVIAARAEVAVEGRVSPGSRPLTHNSQAGVQAWKGAVR